MLDYAYIEPRTLRGILERYFTTYLASERMLAMSDETFAEGVVRAFEQLKSENRRLKENDRNGRSNGCESI